MVPAWVWCVLVAWGAAFGARAASVTYPDVGHYLWQNGGQRTIYKSNCGPGATSAQGFCTAFGRFNPNVAIGAGTDGTLDGLRYGIIPFSGEASPARGRIEGENWSTGNLSNLLRDLQSAPSNPLGLPPGYQLSVADLFDAGYVTLDGVGPAADTLNALRSRLRAQGGLAGGGGPSPATCPACPTCGACPPPVVVTRPQKVCFCPPPPGAFDPNVASSGRLEILLLSPQVDGRCPTCP